MLQRVASARRTPYHLGNERTASAFRLSLERRHGLRHGSQPSHRQSRRRSARPPRVSAVQPARQAAPGGPAPDAPAGGLARLAAVRQGRSAHHRRDALTTRRCARACRSRSRPSTNTLHQFTEAGLLRQLAVDGFEGLFRHEPDRASSLLRGGRGGADGRADPGRHRARPARGAGGLRGRPRSTSWCACAVWTPPRRPPGTCARRADATHAASTGIRAAVPSGSGGVFHGRRAPHQPSRRSTITLPASRTVSRRCRPWATSRILRGR